MKAYARILVPLDGSPLAELALSPALRVADEGSTLVLVRAAEAHSLPGVDPTLAQVEVVREAEAFLADAAARARRLGFTKVETSVWYGPPSWAIVEAAQSRRVDLIVMSSHGRSGLGRLVLGSVAESVLRSTRIPVFLVRAEGAPVEPPPSGAPAPVEAVGQR